MLSRVTLLRTFGPDAGVLVLRRRFNDDDYSAGSAREKRMNTAKNDLRRSPTNRFVCRPQWRHRASHGDAMSVDNSNFLTVLAADIAGLRSRANEASLEGLKAYRDIGEKLWEGKEVLKHGEFPEMGDGADRL
jgi:hypothetical protein